MKRKTIHFCVACVILFAVISIIHYFLIYRTCYLNLQFVNMSGETEIVNKIKISSAEYKNNTIISEPEEIEQIMHYLNTIPLVKVSTSEYENSRLNKTQGCLIQFYNSEELELGWISLSGNNYILRSQDLKTFKAKNTIENYFNW